MTGRARRAAVVAAMPMLVGCGGGGGSDMENTRWALVRMDEAPVPTRLGPAAELHFDRGRRVNGMIVCKGVGTAAGWRDDGTFTNLSGQRSISEAPCSGRDEAVAIGTRFWERMSIATGWRLVDGRMIVTFADRSRALLERLP